MSDKKRISAFNKERLQAIKTAYENTQSIKKTAEVMGISDVHLNRIMRKNGARYTIIWGGEE